MDLIGVLTSGYDCLLGVTSGGAVSFLVREQQRGVSSLFTARARSPLSLGWLSANWAPGSHTLLN